MILPVPFHWINHKTLLKGRGIPEITWQPRNLYRDAMAMLCILDLLPLRRLASECCESTEPARHRQEAMQKHAQGCVSQNQGSLSYRRRATHRRQCFSCGLLSSERPDISRGPRFSAGRTPGAGDMQKRRGGFAATVRLTRPGPGFPLLIAYDAFVSVTTSLSPS